MPKVPTVWNRERLPGHDDASQSNNKKSTENILINKVKIPQIGIIYEDAINKPLNNKPSNGSVLYLTLILNNNSTELIFELTNASSKLLSSGKVYDNACSSPITDNTLIGVKKDGNNITINVSSNPPAPLSQYVNMEIKMSNFTDIFKFEVNVYQDLQKNVLAEDANTNSSSQNERIKNLLKKINNNDLSVYIDVQTDGFGLNLGEFTAIVNATKTYPGGYPKELIGKCYNIVISPINADGLIQTLYSKTPNLSKVLKGNGNTLLAQTDSINENYDTGLSDCDFYDSILIYSALKYMFAGLSSGKFSVDWLYSKNNKKFIESMKNSDFSEFLILFTDPIFGFVGYKNYFKCGKENCSKCI